MSDAQVIEQVLNGDTGAFEILILKYQSQIFYSALNIVKNKEYADALLLENKKNAMKKYQYYEKLAKEEK